jgi:uncharacterized membrane protein
VVFSYFLFFKYNKKSPISELGFKKIAKKGIIVIMNNLFKQFIILGLGLVLFLPISVLAVDGEYQNIDEIGYEDVEMNEVIPEYEPPVVNYFRAKVVEVVSEDYDDDPLVPAIQRFSQSVIVEFISGDKTGETMELLYIPGSTQSNSQDLKVSDVVLVAKSESNQRTDYYIIDRYRINSVVVIALLFFGLAIIFAGWKGVRSIFGLAFTIFVIVWFMIPAIISGQNPLLVSLVSSLVIAFVALYIAHGFNRRTTIALVSTMITVCIAIFLAMLFVSWAKLFGLGSEEAFYVQLADFGTVNLKGLLLGGIIIGVLGVLDDITTAQAATVEEIYRANPSLSRAELYKRGTSVGHEHIASLINTLALAYVGASLPLMLLFTQSDQPLWVVLNSERVIEEIIRTLIGSSALIIAVPITTYLAAYYFSKRGIKPTDKDLPAHHHHH